MKIPSQIIAIEQAYNIRLQLTESDILLKSNTYQLNDNNEIIALDLSENQIQDISVLGSLTQLVKLDLRNNQIQDISVLGSLTQLRELDLSENQIQDISVFESLTQLRELDLSENQIQDINVLENLYQLKILGLSKVYTNDLSVFQKLTQLKELDLSENQIQDISVLEDLIRLTALCLAENQIQNISTIQNLIRLRELDLSDNNIEDISALQNLLFLRELDLSDNEIHEISALKNLIQLRELDLSYNEIKNIDVLRSLNQLINIDLSENNIHDISPLQDLKLLTVLDLNNNKIQNINVLKYMPSIIELYLYGNQINDISVFTDLSQLRILNLGGNQIWDTSVLKRLTNLKELYLWSNQIQDIIELKSLTQLKTLYLQNNNISSLESLNPLLYLEELENLTIHNNPFLYNTNIVLKTGENHLNIIKNELQKLLDKQRILTALPLKIMCLGNHHSGKSTFTDYFINGVIENKHNSTHVLQVKQYPAKTSDELPKAIFYDFGGQDYYHGIYQAFFSLDTLNLVFWQTNTDKNEYAQDKKGTDIVNFNRGYWLGQIQYALTKKNVDEDNTCKEPIFLIQTYADENPQDFTHYNGVTQLYYISLKEEAEADGSPHKLHIEYLKNCLLQHIANNPKVEKTSAEIDLYNHIYKQAGFAKTEIKSLLQIYKKKATEIHLLKGELQVLNNRGMVMYYADTVIDEYVWLNPQAVVTQLHKKVFSKELVGNGIVAKTYFEEIFNNAKLDKELIEVLKLNKVIFYDAAYQSYIIPGYLPLLNEKSNEDYFLFSDFSKPNFVLKFTDFIPLGFINQLICYYGKNPDRKIYRRNYLVFTLSENKTPKAKVMIHLDFSCLEISVSIKGIGNNKVDRNIEIELFSDLVLMYLDKLFVKIHSIGSSKERVREQDLLIVDEDGNILESKYDANIHKRALQAYSKILPHGMYISLDNTSFVHYNTLMDEDKTYDTIASYKRNTNKEINFNEPFIITTLPFKHLCSNKNISAMKKIFISYSRKDIDYRDALRKHLNFAKLFGIVDNWACEDIKIGNWHEQIQKELEDADLVIMLLSIDFFSSRYIIEHEVLKTIQDIEKGSKKKIYPIIVREFPDIAKLQQKKINDDHITNAITAITNEQYGMYDIEKDAQGNSSERIFSLREFKEKNKLDFALAKIVDKIVSEIN